MKRNLQKGLTTVEFAIVSFTVLLTILGLVDLSRIWYTVAVLDDVTRRGARVAAVCPVNDPAIGEIAVFSPGGGAGSVLVNGLLPGHVLVQYLDEDGGPVPSPGGAGFDNIRFVRVSIDGNAFQIQSLVPFLPQIIVNAPAMQTTMPRESLGIPRVGAGPVFC